MSFLKYKRIYLGIFLFFIVASLASLGLHGLKFGIEFTGGTIFEVRFEQERPDLPQVRQTLVGEELGPVEVQTTGDQGMIFRMKDLSAQERATVLTSLETFGEFEELRFESIGPVVGKELRDKTLILIVLSLAVIILYIAFAFSRIKEPLSSWYYGGVSLFALFLDVLVPLGVFAYLGAIYGIQVTIPVVVALLTVIGYSINNTVVVFDRIRENTVLREKDVEFDFEEVMSVSIRQTLSRQLNTAISTLLVLGAIFFFGGETLRYFALALILGISMGIYSSLFVAPTLLSYLARRRGVDTKKNI